MAKPKITRIKAGESSTSKAKEEQAPILRKKVVIKDKKSEKAKKATEAQEAKQAKQAKQAEDVKSGKKKVFILFRPFAAFGRYLKESWGEIRQVRWPNRKATWKMVAAVLIYTAIFVVLISLLDLFFKWLFNLIIK